MRYEFEIISNRESLRRFGHKFQLASGSVIPEDFLVRATVIGFYEKVDGEPLENRSPVGGIVFNFCAPFRSLDAIVESSEHAKVPPSVVEIVGLFWDRDKRSLAARIQVMATIHTIVALSGKAFVLAITTKEGLWKGMYERLGGQIIHHGSVSLSPGVSRRGWVFVIDRKSLLWRMPQYFAFKLFGHLSLSLPIFERKRAWIEK